MKTIIFTTGAAKDHDALPAEARTEVDVALDGYARDGRGDVKRLQGSPYYRLRAGRYRIVFDEDQTTILAIYIGKRETTTYRASRTRKGPGDEQTDPDSDHSRR